MGFFLRLFSSRKSVEENSYATSVQTLIGFKPITISLYTLAFRHRSVDKNINSPQNNERLEFLGDAILGAVVAEYLYNQYPSAHEGFLTSMRSKIVSRNNLNQIANQLQIETLIVSNLDKRKKAKSINGDTLEALIGAIYLDIGLEAASSFIKSRILGDAQSFSELEKQVLSFKSKLIEWSQKERKSLSFVPLNSWGSDHNKTFEMGVLLDEQIVGSGIGRSKKLAEESAAHSVFTNLSLEV
jgi:ribonuclease-3